MYCSVFLFINGGILSYLSFLIWPLWEGFVIIGLSLIDLDLSKRSGCPNLPKPVHFWPPFCHAKLRGCMDDLRTIRTTRKNRGEGGSCGIPASHLRWTRGERIWGLGVLEILLSVSCFRIRT